MLSVSSMAFGDEVPVGGPGFPALAGFLRDRGVSGIELVPAQEWRGWEGATPAAAARLRDALSGEGMACPAFQSILFGVEGAAVFAGGDAGRRIMADHVARVADLAAPLGASVLVFGSPGLRRRGDLPGDEASAVAADFLRGVAERIAPSGVALCIEPNSRGYGCDFVTTMAEADALVRAVDHPSFGLHLDTGSACMERAYVAGEVEAFAGRFRHAHVSEPRLAPFEADSEVDHAAVADALARTGYEGWTSLEMARADLGTVRSCVAAFAAAYGREPRPVPGG